MFEMSNKLKKLFKKKLITRITLSILPCTNYILHW